MMLRSLVMPRRTTRKHPADQVTLSRGYTNQFCVTVDVNEHAAVKTQVAAANLPAVVKRKAMKQQTFATLQAYLTSSATKQQQELIVLRAPRSDLGSDIPKDML